MEEVKISYNKQAWNKEGTYYRGCFTMSKALFELFQNYVQSYMKRYENRRILSSQELKEVTYLPALIIEKEQFTRRDCVFLKLTQRDKLVEFLRSAGIKFNPNRALGNFNYYIEIK